MFAFCAGLLAFSIAFGLALPKMRACLLAGFTSNMLRGANARITVNPRHRAD
jgi:hypothetical protein